MDEALLCLDREMCRLGCRWCDSYGQSWACPPFDVIDFEALRPERFKNLALFVMRVTFDADLTVEELRRALRPRLGEMMRPVRETAANRHGVCYGFACLCDLCTEHCTRPQGRPCRHPSQVCPSLEAVGFNVTALLENFTPFRLEWGKNGHAPNPSTYVAAAAF